MFDQSFPVFILLSEHLYKLKLIPFPKNKNLHKTMEGSYLFYSSLSMDIHIQHQNFQVFQKNN